MCCSKDRPQKTSEGVSEEALGSGLNCCKGVGGEGAGGGGGLRVTREEGAIRAGEYDGIISVL